MPQVLIIYYCFKYIIKVSRMKDRLTYSPTHHHYTHQSDITFKKSPLKYVQYDSPLHPQDFSSRDNLPSISNFKEFDNLKKLAEETSALRQTMNIKYLNKLQKNHVLQFQEEKANKFNDYLRQTTKFKPAKTYSETHIPGENVWAVSLKEVQLSNQKNIYQSHPARKGLELINDNKSLQEYERLSEKINRNKQLIDQLRRTNKHHPREMIEPQRDFQSHETIVLESKRLRQDQEFKYTFKESNYLTPKVDKPTRFNSPSLIQHAKSIQKSYEQPTVSSLTSVSSIKRKYSATVTDRIFGIDQFTVYKKLGQGKFGIVNLVKHKKSNSIFALKKISKTVIKTNMMVDQLAKQIRIQSCLRNTNVLQMYGFFDDSTNLYVVLQYMDGGTLYEKLKRERLNQREASMIVKQITKAIEYLHDLGIAHRDLKPENIVICNNVYKLCDFGWAAICNERRKTYCGTFDYVAPEIIEGAEYDMTVDLWCLGVLTFQILAGKAPFYHISRKETMKKILNVEHEDLTYPQGVSDVARDFIDRLIRKNPEERITANQALKHPFLKLGEHFN